MPISTPSDPQAAALLSRLLTRIQDDISFLAAQNYIAPTEATDLITRLSQGPPTANPTSDSLVPTIQNLAVGPPRTTEPARRIPPPPPRNTVKANAIWAYNEDGRDVNDLSFSPGDIIEIIEETNADWWLGKCRGKQGLFPSNHVQKLDNSSNPATISPPPAPVSMPSAHSMPMAPSYYSPPPGPPQPYGMPPSNEKMYQSHYVPAVPVQAPAPPVQVIEQPAEPKKNRFGKLGNTMATSAAGGVGFGAGAAIGSGIVHAIF